MAADTDGASLANPLLTSCCAAQVLAGHPLVLVCGPGLGGPWLSGPTEGPCLKTEGISAQC